MFDLRLDGYGSILVVQREDLDIKTHREALTREKILDLVWSSRARYRAVIIEIDPALGLQALPKRWRDLPIRAYQGDYNGVWIMAQNEEGIYV